MKPPFDHDVGGRGTTIIKPIFLSKSQREQLSLHDHEQRQEKEITASRHEQEHEKNLSYKRSKREPEKAREEEEEKELIKQNYLGTSQQPKKKKRLNDKFRFCFDWDNNEDTSSLHHNPPHEEAVLLFGRGFRAGMDRREQKKKKKKLVADRHWAEKKLEEMNERDWRIFKEHYNMSYKGGGSKLPRPMRSWAECRLSFQLLKAVESAGYKNPSPIQMAAIPLGLQQRDVIGVSETGSGKTAAFVLPMLNYISRLTLTSDHSEVDSGEEGPYAVVMAPTRELAQQIENETVKFAQCMDKGSIRVVSIVGGQSIEEQGFKIMQGCEVVIATPGRLLDCLERRLVVLNRCNYVVLDEADRMIDMGFEKQVMAVLDQLPCTNLKPENEFEELDEKKIYRTTYMFSATMPPAVERLARKYLRNPVVVTIEKSTSLISQHVIMMKESEKMFRLQRLLDEVGDKTAIVFVNTKKAADSLFKGLDNAGYHVTSFHGGKSQEQREISLEGFRNRRYNVLVATDVAGRGIDIPDVAHVVNFDMPDKIEMYAHRIGRTGRAGKTGVATTLLTLHDSQVFYDLKQVLIHSNSHVPPELARHEASKFKPGTILDRPPRRI